jgi:hypothetical protein
LGLRRCGHHHKQKCCQNSHIVTSLLGKRKPIIWRR